jgi:hypothetical protein
MLDNALQTNYCHNEFQQFCIFPFLNQKASRIDFVHDRGQAYSSIQRSISTSAFRTPSPALICNRCETM